MPRIIRESITSEDTFQGFPSLFLKESATKSNRRIVDVDTLMEWRKVQVKVK